MSPLSHSCSLFQEIRAVGAELGITPVIIRGEDLKQKGFGGTVTVYICLKLTHLSLIQIVYLFLPVSLPDQIFSFLNKINMQLKNSHLFRNLWSWQGSRTSSRVSSPEPPARWCNTNHCMGRQGNCV